MWLTLYLYWRALAWNIVRRKRDEKGDLLGGAGSTTVGVLISQKMAHRYPAPGALGKEGSGS